MKGIIALDIDGTITVGTKPIPQEVIEYFHHLVKEGWNILFITGRTHALAQQVLHPLPFPYYLAVQNGAAIIEISTGKILNKKYLDKSIFPMMEKICENEATDFAIYAGFEYDDRIYYRPKYFSSELWSYVQHRRAILNESWCDIKSLEHLDINSFSSVKCFGSQESIKRIAQQMEQSLNLHVPTIRDPFSEIYFIAQGIHPEASKGYALQIMKSFLGNQVMTIAAGDDTNDLTMLREADIKVVMGNAPQELIKEADIIAPTAVEKGIIAGVSKAILRGC